jgi:hypothetical protein
VEDAAKTVGEDEGVLAAEHQAQKIRDANTSSQLQKVLLSCNDDLR